MAMTIGAFQFAAGQRGYALPPRTGFDSVLVNLFYQVGR